MVTQVVQSNRVPRDRFLDAELPITSRAHQELLVEIERTDAAMAEALVLRNREIRTLGEESGPAAEAELLILRSRLESLTRAAAASTVVNQNGQAVVGSRVTVRRAAEDDVTYELVPPGMSDVRRGRISADSALGTTLIGREPNEHVVFRAPVGEQHLTIIDVREGAP
jgi:transcription elongation GreA/GreB family factor